MARHGCSLRGSAAHGAAQLFTARHGWSRRSTAVHGAARMLTARHGCSFILILQSSADKIQIYFKERKMRFFSVLYLKPQKRATFLSFYES